MSASSGRGGGAKLAGGAAACGCGVDDRKAVGVDTAAKGRNLVRLRRIAGQVQGIQRMVEEDRYCADIIMQLSAARQALRAVGRELMRNHLRHCAGAAVKEGGTAAERMYDELVDLMDKATR